MSSMDDKIVGVRLGELRNRFENELNTQYEVAEIRQHFALLCASHLEYGPAQVVLNLQEKVSEQIADLLLNDLAALQKHVPIQYIIGNVDFADVLLKIDKSVLIPRPETEELVHWILSTTPDDKPLRVLDIGTGSGCIALALKKARPLWRISAWDIDRDALSLAQHNAESNQLHIDFQQVDVLTKDLPESNWDVIVSNPPYVPAALTKNTKPHVINHEPKHAIFVPDESPLIFYEHIIDYAYKHLAFNGTLFFEGHAPLMKSVEGLLQEAGFSDIVLQNDFRTNPRFTRAIRQ